MDNETTLPKEIHVGVERVLEKLEITNYSLTVTKGSSKGDNYLGIITKIKACGQNKTGQSATLHLVIKIAPEAKEFREYIKIEPIYQREIHMYQTMFPALFEFQMALQIESPFNPFAKCLGSSLTPPHEYLIMEDMSMRGFKMKDRKSEADLAHCLLVMTAYGKYHALALALKAKQPTTYQKLLNSTREAYFNVVNLDNLCTTIQSPCEKIIKNLDEAVDGDLIGKVKRFGRFPVEGLLDNLSADAAGDHAVFCHGDCWSNNILFKYEDEDPSKPIDLCILDWQLSRCASPACDLAYFLFSYTDKKLREHHYEELLETYHSSFQQFLEKLGCDRDLFPKNVLLDHMRRFSKYGLMMSLIVVPLVTAENEELPDWTSDLSQDERKRMFSDERKNEKISVERLVDIVRDFDRFGYFA